MPDVQRESVANVTDFEWNVTRGADDFNDIEPEEPGRLAQFAQVGQGGATQSSAFVTPDGFPGAAQEGGPARADFHENEHIAFAGDQVDFAARGRPDAAAASSVMNCCIPGLLR